MVNVALEPQRQTEECYMSSKCPLCGENAFSLSRFGGYYCYPRMGGCGMSSSVAIEEYKGLLSFRINSNEYLDKQVNAYAHGLYIPYRSTYSGDLTDLILNLKGRATCNIDAVKTEAANIIQKDLDIIITSLEKYQKHRPIVVAMARSKPDNFWPDYALQFRPAISRALSNSRVGVEKSDGRWMLDGVQFLQRVKETQTTHLARSTKVRNNGPAPYRGITKDTCVLNGDVHDKYIILVDDIYTTGVCVDEDCIQYLYDNGAQDVLLYVLGITVTPPKESTENESSSNDL